MGLPLVDKVLGSLMAFSWLSAVLYGVSLFLYAHYFRTAKNDLVWIRIAIVLALAVDTASTINQGVMIYRSVVFLLSYILTASKSSFDGAWDSYGVVRLNARALERSVFWCPNSSKLCCLLSQTHWGDYDYLATQPATFFGERQCPQGHLPLIQACSADVSCCWGVRLPVYIVTTGLSAVIIQTYLLVRIWKLKRNIFLLAVLLLCMLTAFGGALATASSIQWVFKSLAQRNNISKFVYIWLISSAGKCP